MESDIEVILEDLERCRTALIRKAEENSLLKKELKRQKKTAYAYQLVFGANPEKARILLQNLQQPDQSKVQPPSPPTPVVPQQQPIYQPPPQPQIVIHQQKPSEEYESLKNLPIFGEIRMEMKRLKDEIKGVAHSQRENRDSDSVIRQLQQELQVMKGSIKTTQPSDVKIDKKIEETLAKRDAALLQLIEDKLDALSKTMSLSENREIKTLRDEIRATQNSVIRSSINLESKIPEAVRQVVVASSYHSPVRKSAKVVEQSEELVQPPKKIVLDEDTPVRKPPTRPQLTIEPVQQVQQVEIVEEKPQVIEVKKSKMKLQETKVEEAPVIVQQQQFDEEPTKFQVDDQFEQEVIDHAYDHDDEMVAMIEKQRMHSAGLVQHQLLDAPLVSRPYLISKFDHQTKFIQTQQTKTNVAFEQQLQKQDALDDKMSKNDYETKMRVCT